jgi:peptide/nickel transport system permease protein
MTAVSEVVTLETRSARRGPKFKTVFSTTVLAVYLLVALFGRFIEPYPPNKLDVGGFLEGPSPAHWFGTDDLGRDQLSRIIDATWIAVTVAVGAALIALVFGALLGAIAGFRGGVVDTVVVWVFDILFSFPALLLAIVLIGALGPNVLTATVAIGIVYIPRVGRLARTSTQNLRNLHFIEAAKLSRMPEARVILTHILPNISSPLIVITAVHMAESLLAYSALSFLGLGARPPQADYGTMLSAARSFMVIDPLLVLFPAVALVLFVVALNLFGDVLRDRLDPLSQRTVTF